MRSNIKMPGFCPTPVGLCPREDVGYNSQQHLELIDWIELTMHIE